MKKILLLFILWYPGVIFAQLDFCKGSKGDPIFHENFGPGTGTGNPLPVTTTNYTYVTGDPDDGEYTISGRVGQNNNTWHNHLPSTTISGGRALIVNASFTSGLFYTTPITGLCENSSYEFSAFLMNVYNPASAACTNGGIPINVRFEIWDHSNSNLLKEGSTGNIVSTINPRWQQYAMTFQSGPGQGSVILKMFNNGVGGCGNDLAIDDIVFRSCGDLTELSAGSEISNYFMSCQASAPEGLTITATPDNSIYTRHFFQWQESDDGETWNNIGGERKDKLIIGEITSSKLYRVKVAEDENNLNNNFCSTVSEVFEIKYIETPAAPVSSGDMNSCSNEEAPYLHVAPGINEIVNWYDAPVGGTLLRGGSTTYQPEIAGTYYAESVNTSGCPPGPRTAVTYQNFQAPGVEDEVLEICQEATLRLNAGISNVQYEWSTGERGREIMINTAGNYWVIITTNEGCSVEKNFNVTAVVTPEISQILSEEKGITILTGNVGNFEYSLDGVNYKTSNFFSQIPGGIYTAYVRDPSGCNTVSLLFPHIVIQKYFSPNNDGYNDLFELPGVDYYRSSYIRVYDRYGKLLAAGEGKSFSWDGTFKGAALPADDYWYEIYIEDLKEVKGHISLVR